jgi:hypothetical protein
MLRSVAWGESATDPGIQAVDMITGAIVASHNLGLSSARPLNPGKRLLITRLASTLGWPDLFCDTYPNTKFNIWHFPDDKKGSSQWRAIPESRAAVFRADVAHVRWEDIATLHR